MLNILSSRPPWISHGRWWCPKNMCPKSVCLMIGGGFSIRCFDPRVIFERPLECFQSVFMGLGEYTICKQMCIYIYIHCIYIYAYLSLSIYIIGCPQAHRKWQLTCGFCLFGSFWGLPSSKLRNQTGLQSALLPATHQLSVITNSLFVLNNGARSMFVATKWLLNVS